ncbi:MAG: hypothetical protein LBL38_00795 [Lactobacillales bacterium]|jgi:hypothetical protein|nr:hypothetical protein [Lactobacillales bacterium]
MNCFKKVILLFAVFSFFSTLKAGAIPIVRQINGQPVTKLGQRVIFAGANGYKGVNTPAEHQTDATDIWLVMQVERNCALILKQNPIAIQEYQHQSNIARYDRSDIKKSVTAWWSMVNNVRLNDFSIQDYTLLVKLNGENRSNVNADITDITDFDDDDYDSPIHIQSRYKTTVDPNGSVYAFVPSYIDVNTTISGHVDVGDSIWSNFVVEPHEESPESLDPRLLQMRDMLDEDREVGVIRCTDANCTHLRSPLYKHFYSEDCGIAAYITASGSISSGDDVPMIAHFGVRPACWVNISN